MESTRPAPRVIRTPDQRLRVFVSSTLQELAPEREAAREAIARLNLTPVMFELGARPHPPRELYRAYLEQSHVFVGIYWQRYGWVAPGEEVSGLEDEYLLSGDRPKLIYVKRPAPEREARLAELIDRIRGDDMASYKPFESPEELRELLENDLALLLSERFEAALPARSARVDNVPRPFSSLVDRERELVEVRDLLLRDDVALVTLTGPAGTGKSRLALQLGLDLGDRFAAGACWVSLATVRDPDLLVPAIGQALDLREPTGNQTLDRLLHERLRDAEMLLVLDNFEQVVEAATGVAELLSRCPRLKVLVTSRTPLQVRGERVYAVAPLTLPDAGAGPERVAEAPAVALFLDRAAAVSPGFALTAENAQVIAEVCRQLDGLPLAIELTAARLKLFSPRALLDRLTRHRGARLDLSSAGARDLPARQRTLRRALDWSHDLLPGQAQALFRRLAAFEGGWTLDAAEAVANADDDLGVDVLEELQALQDMSLLTRQDPPGGEPRFGMLRTVQEYALERLVASGEAEAVRRRHAEFFLALAEEADAALLRPDREPWVARLAQEHDNLRAVLAWSLGADRRLGLRLAGALGYFWLIQSHFSEGRRWLALLLEGRADLGHTIEVARALAVAGSLAWRQGDAAEGELLLNESVAMCRELGDDELAGFALAHLGLTVLAQGRPAEAHTRFAEALERYRSAGHAWGITFSLVWLGTTTRTSGDQERALALHAESLARARELDDPWLLASALDGLADLRLAQGNAEAARPLYEEANQLFRRVGDRHALAWGVASLAFALLRLGEDRRAQALFEETLALGREYDNPTLALLYLTGMAGIATLRGQDLPPEEGKEARLRAARLFGAVDRLHGELGAAMWQAFSDTADELQAAAREELDPADWDAAFAAGRALSLERAIALAADASAGA